MEDPPLQSPATNNCSRRDTVGLQEIRNECKTRCCGAMMTSVRVKGAQLLNGCLERKPVLDDFAGASGHNSIHSAVLDHQVVLSSS